MRRLAVVLVACSGSAKAPVTASSTAQPKVATDTFYGVKVDDPYRWLEADTPDVAAWSAQHNTRARDVLDHLPNIEQLRKELHDIIAAPITQYYSYKPAGGKLFALRKLPAKEQPDLVVMDDPAHADTAKLIIDPAASGNAQQAIDWFVPSPDGTKVAVSLSVGGSEDGTLHVLDLDGKEVDRPVADVQRGTGGGDVAWTPDGTGFYFTKYPASGDDKNFFMQVWFHTLGGGQDRYEMGKDLPKIAEIMLETDSSGRVLASVQNGDGGTFRHYLKSGDSWRQLDDWADSVMHVSFGPTRDLWLVSRDGAPNGKVLRLPENGKLADAKVVIPANDAAIAFDFHDEAGVLATKDRLYVAYQLGGPSELRVFSLDGAAMAKPALPPVSAVGWPTKWKTGVIVGARSYTTPWTVGYFDPASGKLETIPALSPKPPVDLSGFEVIRQTARSKDGTQVPFTVIRAKGAPQDGSVPCLVNGYGGYGVNEEPFYGSVLAPLLQRGVCFVHTNLRGGGEFGEAWHRAGALTNKQNVFDDFAAVLETLIAKKYTSTPKLAILGGSNGGLLMGAMITQHPDLVHTVVAEVGIYDMLRVELSPNGQYNVTEFGTVKDEAQFRAMYAYSPYHHVTKRAYPAILMTTGANDPRVSPWQSRKMVAALEAAQTGNAAILLRTSDKAGHGMGSSMTERIDLQAHVEAFLLAQLGK